MLFNSIVPNKKSSVDRIVSMGVLTAFYCHNATRMQAKQKAAE
jgi:hypothetical protein